MLKQEKDQFTDWDKSKDGKLEKTEVRSWAIPDQTKAAAEEADHLVKETDKDGDGKLAKKEITEMFELWVGSAATQYGQDIQPDYYHDPEEL